MLQKLTLKNHLKLIIIISAVFLIGASILVKYYQFQINPDGTAYVGIAQKYAQGDIDHAINNFWPPLISWLLAPFIYIGISPLLSSKIFSILIGLGVLWGLWSLSFKFRFDNNTRYLLLFSAIPVLWQFAFSVISPDFLLTLILILYLNLIFSKNYPNILNGAFAGLLGGLVGLSKSFGIFFFTSSFIIFNLLFWLRTKKSKKMLKRQIVLTFLTGIAVFSVITTSWITVLSLKNNRFSFYALTYTAFTHAFVGPYVPNLFSFPKEGLIPPPEGGTSAWDDPTNIKVISWSPFDSWENFNYLIHKSKIHSITILLSLTNFSYLSLPVILMFLILLARKIKEREYFTLETFILFTFLLYLPLILAWTDGRHLQLLYLLILLLGGSIISKLVVYKKLLLFIFILSVIKSPLQWLYTNVDAGKEHFQLASEIARIVPINKWGKLASNNNYYETVYLSFYLGANYFGYPIKSENEKDYYNGLKDNQIDYYIAWKNTATPLSVRENFKEITKGKITKLEIYDLR